MKMRTDVVFYCWRCGQKIAVPEIMQGKLLPCPKCERLLTVPPGFDVPKRVVPEAETEEVIPTENDVTFDCVYCNYLLVADKRGAGMTLPCPGCGGLITVPEVRTPATKKTAAPAEQTAPNKPAEQSEPPSGVQAYNESLQA